MPIIENTYGSWSKANNAPRGIGPRLDAPTYYWKRGVWFQLPYGYLNPWPIRNPGTVQNFNEYKDAISRNSTRTGYDASTGRFNPDLLEESISSPTFSFWMPSLRYVERDMMFTTGTQKPCEAGRKPPTKNDYIVKFRIEWPGLDGSEASKHSEMFLNASKRRLNNKFFVQIFEDEFAALLRCTAGRDCNGWIWDKENDIIIFIVFPESLRQAAPEDFWRAPVDASIQLLKDWTLEKELGHGN